MNATLFVLFLLSALVYGFVKIGQKVNDFDEYCASKKKELVSMTYGKLCVPKGLEIESSYSWDRSKK